MKKEHTLVDCGRCNYWDTETKRLRVCGGCNNSGKVVDPRELLCNLCGESVCPIGTMNEQYTHGLYEAKVTGGYDSYQFSFCEKCLRGLFNQCKIPPDLTDHSGEEEDYAQDREAYEYRVWRSEGGYHQAYVDGKCNAVKNCANKATYTQLISGEWTESCSCEDHKELWQYSNSQMVKFIPNVLKPFL